jgi:hypothetical protein
MDVQTEKRHVSKGPDPGERSRSGTDRLIFRSSKPGEVLEKARAVLQVVLDHQAPWPTEDQWRAMLPAWFVQARGPEQTQGEAKRYLEYWRSVSPKQQAEEDTRRAWALTNWLYWFDPEGMGDERGWAWLSRSISVPTPSS